MKNEEITVDRILLDKKSYEHIFVDNIFYKIDSKLYGCETIAY